MVLHISQFSAQGVRDLSGKGFVRQLETIGSAVTDRSKILPVSSLGGLFDQFFLHLVLRHNELVDKQLQQPLIVSGMSTAAVASFFGMPTGTHHFGMSTGAFCMSTGTFPYRSGKVIWSKIGNSKKITFLKIILVDFFNY